MFIRKVRSRYLGKTSEWQSFTYMRPRLHLKFSKLFKKLQMPTFFVVIVNISISSVELHKFEQYQLQ